MKNSMSEDKKSNMYETWADDLMQSMLEHHDDPFSEWSYEAVRKALSVKLEEDVKDIVVEWFCSDCDYQRMYGQ